MKAQHYLKNQGCQWMVHGDPCNHTVVGVYVSDDNYTKACYVCAVHAEMGEQEGDGPVFYVKNTPKPLQTFDLSTTISVENEILDALQTKLQWEQPTSQAHGLLGWINETLGTRLQTILSDHWVDSGCLWVWMKGDWDDQIKDQMAAGALAPPDTGLEALGNLVKDL